MAKEITYANSAQYIDAVHHQHQPVVSIPYVIDLYSHAVSAPEQDHFTVEKEFRQAHSYWNLHGRPLLHLNDAASSLLILVIFGLGFIGRARPEDEVAKPAEAEAAKKE